MIIINFAHPLTAVQRTQLEQLLQKPIAEIRDVPSQLDNGRPLAEQVVALVDSLGLSAEAWQTESILINPPSYAPITVVLVAELHGRMGYFPAIIRIRPINNSTPTQYEVAEVINLQAVREIARARR